MPQCSGTHQHALTKENHASSQPSQFSKTHSHNTATDNGQYPFSIMACKNMNIEHKLSDTAPGAGMSDGTRIGLAGSQPTSSPVVRIRWCQRGLHAAVGRWPNASRPSCSQHERFIPCCRSGGDYPRLCRWYPLHDGEVLQGAAG